MAISNYIGSDQELFKYQYNGDDYLVCGSFVSLDDSGNGILLKGNAFKYIEIVDNIYHPFHTAEIIVNNNLNFFDKEYNFLGNGRDMLVLTILPNSDQDAILPHNNEDFVLKFEFIITECIDINYENALCKRLKLVEAKEYKLSETFFNIAGVQRSLGGFSYLSSNEGNAKPTSSWIKSILSNVYTEMNDNIFIKDKEGKDFFEESNCINIDITPHGAIPNISVLNYVLQFHTHNESPCILRFDRVKKKFFVLSYNTLFSNSELFCKDEIHFGRQSNEIEKNTPDIEYDYFSRIWGEYALLGNSGKNSQIIEFYRENPDAALILKFFSKEGMSSYSRAHGAFMYNTQALAPEEIIQKYNKLFVEPFKKLFNKNELTYNFILPQSTAHMQNAWKTVTDSLPPEMNEEKIKIKKLSNLLNLNYTYMFKLKGSTVRKAATFVDVLKFNNIDTDERYDFNNLGRHLVTTVKHIFTENTYFNKIETIKPYKLTPSQSKYGMNSINNLLKS
jgi:hypothetical protein